MNGYLIKSAICAAFSAVLLAGLIPCSYYKDKMDSYTKGGSTACIVFMVLGAAVFGVLAVWGFRRGNSYRVAPI